MTEQTKKLSKAQRQAQNDKKAGKIIKWIFVALILLAILFMVWTFSIM